MSTKPEGDKENCNPLSQHHILIFILFPIIPNEVVGILLSFVGG
jgi:hypothetical protein